MCKTYKRREIITVRGGEAYVPNISLQNVIGFKVLKVECANAFYNVIQNVNNTFEWRNSAAVAKITTISPGHYDPVQFASALETLMNLVDAGTQSYTITYNQLIKRFTISSSAAFHPLWVSGGSSAKNTSFIMGFFNDTTGNELLQLSHTSDFPVQLVPSHYLIKSSDLSSGRKSSGGGGGTQIRSEFITSSPQNYITTLPNQADGTFSVFIYRATDDDAETFEYNAPRQISQLKIEIVHPYYPDINQSDEFYSIYSPITYEIEFECEKRFK
jgi:hypothetical protein